jgi:flagellar L-ring protein precursor FlgH
MNRTLFALAAAAITLPAGPAPAQSAEPDGASTSLMTRMVDETPAGSVESEPHALRDVSMFAVAPPEPPSFAEHDLIQIIIRETSQAKSTHELETEKEYDLDAKIQAWPDFDLTDLLQLQLMAGRTDNLPELKLDFTKEFSGEGDYKRKDDLTARLTAEVIEVLPNGNLVLEARTSIKTDTETTTMRATGVCRPEDVTPANTILSNQLHDLKIDKGSEGELKKTAEKGIISKVLDFVFAF